MKISLINAGLGNQAFQYIFGRYIEIKGGTPVYYDDSAYPIYTTLRLNEQIKQFGESMSWIYAYRMEEIFPNLKKPLLLSEYFDPDVWMHMVQQANAGCSIPQQLLNNGMDLFMVAESSGYAFDGNLVMSSTNQFNPALAFTQGNVYFYGYWICKDWFIGIEDIILHELEFPPIKSKQNQQYYDHITKSISVGIHIRRGDFVNHGWALPEAYYYNALKKISDNLRGATYFVFSDDLDWCKRNARELGFDYANGNIVYVEGNYNRENSYVDMQLLSVCKHLIVGNSSFSFLASLLNRNKERLEVSTRSSR